MKPKPKPKKDNDAPKVVTSLRINASDLKRIRDAAAVVRRSTGSYIVLAALDQAARDLKGRK